MSGHTAEAASRVPRQRTPLQQADGQPDSLPRVVVWTRRDQPVIDPAVLLDLRREEDGFLWESADGALWAGVGATAELRAEGPQRFTELTRAAQELYEHLELEETAQPAGRTDAPGLRLFGGLSFRPTLSESLWRPFSAGSFVLPRLCVRCDGARSDWFVTRDRVRGDAAPVEGAQLRAAALSELDAVRREVEKATERTASRRHRMAPLGSPSERARADEEWMRKVGNAVATIRQGLLDKVVFARREIVPLGDFEPSVQSLCRLLEQVAPESRRFLVRRDRALFVGATPERLVRRRGLAVETVALAGTVHRRPGATLEELSAELLASAKDRHEHQLVVGALRTWLEPLCHSIEFAREPDVRVLRYLLHLETPIRAVLNQPEHVLKLVEALHPTPAVGGRPREAAVSWIDSHEQFDRGWYAGPVGWIDDQGEGEFLVALRSMLLSGGRGYLYAGAGIVGESIPELEFAETEDKLEGIHAIVRSLETSSNRRRGDLTAASARTPETQSDGSPADLDGHLVDSLDDSGDRSSEEATVASV